jgi:hypothetical protein
MPEWVANYVNGPNREIEIQIVIANTSDKKISIADCTVPSFYFAARLVDDQGSAIWKRLSRSNGDIGVIRTSGILREILPGDKYSFRLRLRELIKLPPSGKFTLTVWRLPDIMSVIDVDEALEVGETPRLEGFPMAQCAVAIGD